MTTSSKTQIWQFSVMEIAQAIKQKEISCEETIISHFERIEAVNTKLNAISVSLR